MECRHSGSEEYKGAHDHVRPHDDDCDSCVCGLKPKKYGSIGPHLVSNATISHSGGASTVGVMGGAIEHLPVSGS